MTDNLRRNQVSSLKCVIVIHYATLDCLCMTRRPFKVNPKVLLLRAPSLRMFFSPNSRRGRNRCWDSLENCILKHTYYHRSVQCRTSWKWKMVCLHTWWGSLPWHHTECWLWQLCFGENHEYVNVRNSKLVYFVRCCDQMARFQIFILTEVKAN